MNARASKPKIRAVIFDLGNVLVNYDALKAASRFSRECKVSIAKVWVHFFTSPSEKAYTRGEISTKEFFLQAKKALNMPVGFAVFRKYWNDIFWENEGMVDLLKALRKRYRLYLISNTNEMHFEHIKKKYKVLKYFRKTFPSHEVGCRKPELEIYQKVLKKIRLRPEQTVFIDDTPKFVEGARKAGMHAIRFRNKKQLAGELKKLGIQS